MLADPTFARWVNLGLPRDAGPPPQLDGTASERFAAYEQVVVGRTNALFGGGRPQLPWPRALGTPPWGARRELELGSGPRAGPYAVHPVRCGPRGSLERAFAGLRASVVPGRPALLYVGSPWLPRHVVLVLPATGRSELDVYEPSAGQVVGLRREAFVTRRLALAGWDVPWATVCADPAS